MDSTAMHCVPCDKRWTWHESDRDCAAMYCPVCKKCPDSGLTDEQLNAAYDRAVEKFQTTVLGLPAKGGE
jgi:hypothetical protein